MKLSRRQLVKGAAQHWPSSQISHCQFYSYPVIKLGKKIWDLHHCTAYFKCSDTWLELSCVICNELREFLEQRGLCELLLVAMILSCCIPCMKMKINFQVLDKARQQRFGTRSLPSLPPTDCWQRLPWEGNSRQRNALSTFVLFVPLSSFSWPKLIQAHRLWFDSCLQRSCSIVYLSAAIISKFSPNFRQNSNFDHISQIKNKQNFKNINCPPFGSASTYIYASLVLPCGMLFLDSQTYAMSFFKTPLNRAIIHLFTGFLEVRPLCSTVQWDNRLHHIINWTMCLGEADGGRRGLHNGGIRKKAPQYGRLLQHLHSW